MAEYLVGSDVGTGGTKSVVMDTDGNTLGQHCIEYPLITNNLGYAEHDPEWYWSAVAETIYKAITDSKINPKNIKGVSVSARSPACILVDRELKPLQLAHIWMDRRSTAQCQWLKDNIGEERIFQISAQTLLILTILLQNLCGREITGLIYRSVHTRCRLPQIILP